MGASRLAGLRPASRSRRPMTRLTRTLFGVAAAVLLAAPVSAAETVAPQTTLINEELSKAWKAAELKPSRKASDYEFVRRAFIDIVGRIPTAEEVRDFAEADSSPDKRIKLIHRLLTARDYQPKFVDRTNP